MPADYSIRVLNYAHTDLPFEFCGGVPIHSGKGLATLAMHYTLISGQDEDDFRFTPTSTGQTTSGTYDSTLYFDGSAFGLEGNDLSAIDLP